MARYLVNARNRAESSEKYRDFPLNALKFARSVPARRLHFQVSHHTTYRERRSLGSYWPVLCICALTLAAATCLDAHKAAGLLPLGPCPISHWHHIKPTRFHSPSQSKLTGFPPRICRIFPSEKIQQNEGKIQLLWPYDITIGPQWSKRFIWLWMSLWPRPTWIMDLFSGFATLHPW